MFENFFFFLFPAVSTNVQLKWPAVTKSTRLLTRWRWKESAENPEANTVYPADLIHQRRWNCMVLNDPSEKTNISAQNEQIVKRIDAFMKEVHQKNKDWILFPEEK
jgi:hypothetical protein